MIIFEICKSAYRKINPKNLTDNKITTVTTQREYGMGASVSIGIVHGIGAETGSQALLLAAAAGATSAITGSFLLIAFVVGLVVSNTLIAIATTAGFLRTDRHHKFRTALGIVIAIFSLVLGSIFILGTADRLPAFFI
jgi:high-affinity nickel-transport protein